ncbi:hypothetical protein [Xanthomonas arboricola]|uniref:hypothetical protein n=1 Tax=Xanthomonas arboricola TaxID=56448 RepID=UPI0011B0A21D|nr:hypothetical protein [Xanthomonas arboricola]
MDATIIAAAPSKNKARSRDGQIHQNRNGIQQYFGMKAQIGMDKRTVLVHSVVSTMAKVVNLDSEGGSADWLRASCVRGRKLCSDEEIKNLPDLAYFLNFY